jgi:hypothetical protein
MKKLLLALLSMLCTLPATAGSPVTVYGAVYGTPATVSPLGELRVENPASQLFQDTFSTATLDTINRWTPSNGGGGFLPTSGVGASTLNGGTTVNGFSKLTSLLANGLGVFIPSEPGYLLYNARVNIIPAIGGTSGLSDWGFGTSPATPTLASPITQCVCFELTTANHLTAVTYQTGARVLIADLTSLGYAPTDAAAHKYFIYFRGDITYWAIDDKDNVVANFQTGASGPDINNLPVLFQVISNSGTVTPQLQVNAVSVGDTSHTGTSNQIYNGVTSELQRSNTDSNTALITLTAQGSGTVNSIDQINTNGRGVNVIANLTTVTAGNVVVNIQGKDIPSGQYYTIATTITGGLTATGTDLISLYPGIATPAATLALSATNAILPRTWRVQAVVTTGPITGTIGASVIN